MMEGTNGASWLAYVGREGEGTANLGGRRIMCREREREREREQTPI